VSASPAAPKGQGVREVDLSDEWASMLEEGQPAEVSAAAPSAPSAEARAEFEIPVEAPAETEPGVEQFSISAEPAQVSEASAEDAFEVPVDTPAVPEEKAPFKEALARSVLEGAGQIQEVAATFQEGAPPPAAEKVDEVAPEPPAAEKAPAAKAPEPAPKEPEPEFELDQDYELVLDPEPLVPAHDQRPPDVPIVPVEAEPEPAGKNAAPSNGFASDQFLSDLANEIDQLGIGELSPEFSSSTPAQEAESRKNAAKAERKPASPVDAGPLKEVFDEFRAELGEMGAEDEDLETHYNLGIAFREMGLLEEAISEFQRVAKASEHGRPFRYSMQCYTLLGLTFMDRGQPSIAAMWYERALRLPDIEPESALALRYDLGMAQESAGESDAALKSFSQVYAVNIDYRDVGERIAALQKTTR
jgi:Tetratricopeptide repeat